MKKEYKISIIVIQIITIMLSVTSIITSITVIQLKARTKLLENANNTCYESTSSNNIIDNSKN